MRQDELFLPGEAGDELETASVAQQGSVHQRKDATGKPASGRRGQRSRSLHGQQDAQPQCTVRSKNDPHVDKLDEA